MSDDAKAVALRTIAPIGEAELACRIIEGFTGMRRPVESPELALDSLEAETKAGARRAAVAAMDYWRECIEGMQSVN